MSIYRPGESQSLWSELNINSRFSRLRKNIQVDVCVIGGGIAGLTTAYLLAKEGKSVCVLESNEIGSGQSGRTTAHFMTALDDRYFEIQKVHGDLGARLAAQSHSAAVEKVAQIVKTENFSCDFERVDGFLFALDDPRYDILDEELEAVVLAGLRDVEMVEKSPLDFFDLGTCLKFPRQIQLHPQKYLHCLAQSILAHGGQIYTQTTVSKVNGGPKASVETSTIQTVKCNNIVVATNTSMNDIFAIHTKQAAYRTYVLAFRIPKAAVPKALFWDTLNPYHYLRIEDHDPFHDLLIVGGEDHKTGQEDHPEKNYERLEDWTRARFPFAQEIAYQWSGQIMESVDGLAFLGHNPMDRNNVYVITGDSGNGMTHATIGGLLITDQIMGRNNPWEELYNPSRISLKALPRFLKENANAIAQYKDWFAEKPMPSFDELPAGEGVVFREELSMLAAYKDESGGIQLLSAACPHLGGVVHWNNTEKSWDCPCHGSRFDCYGKVIAGPADKNLDLVDGATLLPEIPEIISEAHLIKRPIAELELGTL